MTLLAIIALNVMLGMFIPLVLIYALIVNPIRDKRKYGARKPRSGKEARESIGSKIGTIAFAILLFAGLLALAGATWRAALPYYQDAPAILFHQYEEKQGIVTDVVYDWETGSRRSWGFDYAALDGEKYKFESLNLNYVGIGNTVVFHYLKHSKYVMYVTDANGDTIKPIFSPTSFWIKLLIYAALTAWFIKKRMLRTISHKALSKQKKLALTISFHTITILILVLSSYMGSLTPFFVVLTVHLLLHYMQAAGGIRANIR